MVSIAARHGPFRPACLTRALVLEALLARAGIRGGLRIGVRKTEGRFEAHAWVEHAGVPLAEASEVVTRFAPFPARGLDPP
jgi:hypothetical protein